MKNNWLFILRWQEQGTTFAQKHPITMTVSQTTLLSSINNDNY